MSGQHHPKCINTTILCIDGNVNNFPDACVCDVASTHFCFQLKRTAIFANVRPQHANSNLHRLDGTNVLQPSIINTRAGAARVVKQIATDSAHKLSARGHNGTVGCLPISSTLIRSCSQRTLSDLSRRLINGRLDQFFYPLTFFDITHKQSLNTG